MSQQYNKHIKRARRAAYLKRRRLREATKTSSKSSRK